MSEFAVFANPSGDDGGTGSFNDVPAIFETVTVRRIPSPVPAEPDENADVPPAAVPNIGHAPSAPDSVARKRATAVRIRFPTTSVTVSSPRSTFSVAKEYEMAMNPNGDGHILIAGRAFEPNEQPPANGGGDGPGINPRTDQERDNGPPVGNTAEDANAAEGEVAPEQPKDDDDEDDDGTTIANDTVSPGENYNGGWFSWFYNLIVGLILFNCPYKANLDAVPTFDSVASATDQARFPCCLMHFYKYKLSKTWNSLFHSETNEQSGSNAPHADSEEFNSSGDRECSCVHYCRDPEYYRYCNNSRFGRYRFSSTENYHADPYSDPFFDQYFERDRSQSRSSRTRPRRRPSRGANRRTQSQSDGRHQQTPQQPFNLKLKGFVQVVQNPNDGTRPMETGVTGDWNLDVQNVDKKLKIKGSVVLDIPNPTQQWSAQTGNTIPTQGNDASDETVLGTSADGRNDGDLNAAKNDTGAEGENRSLLVDGENENKTENAGEYQNEDLVDVENENQKEVSDDEGDGNENDSSDDSGSDDQTQSTAEDEDENEIGNSDGYAGENEKGTVEDVGENRNGISDENVDESQNQSAAEDESENERDHEDVGENQNEVSDGNVDENEIKRPSEDDGEIQKDSSDGLVGEKQDAPSAPDAKVSGKQKSSAKTEGKNQKKKTSDVKPIHYLKIELM